jgi:hypothetical protein
MLLAFACRCAGQTTQGVLSGRVVESILGTAIPGARILLESSEGNDPRTTNADAAGQFTLPLLSPGRYRLRIEAERFQAQQVDELLLPVAGTLDLTVRLRKLSDVLGQSEQRAVRVSPRAILPSYGPDIDISRTYHLRLDIGEAGALESAVSAVVDPRELRDLPLAGRDVYALLVTVPGVTTEAATGRGLGLSANGQRPSASSFLLDGLENNNLLITGPLVTLVPESVQEYKATTSGFAAEYGRTSGILANAVTRPGGNSWHGTVYGYLRNDFLNANEFQRNLHGLSRRPLEEIEPGFAVGGPLLRSRLFVSASLDFLKYRSEGDPANYQLPTTQYAPQPGTFAAGLWKQFPNRPSLEGSGNTVTVAYAAPAALERWIALPRLDWIRKEGREHAFFRVALTRLERPDFIWTPYFDFSSPLINNATSLAGGWLRTLGKTTTDLRFGWTSDELRFDRAHQEVPVMQASDGTMLPGSPASYSFRSKSQYGELAGNWIYSGDRHLARLGGGLLVRRTSGYLTMGQDGYYAFTDLTNFGRDRPWALRVSLSRLPFQEGVYQTPNFDRDYALSSGFLYAQDSYQPVSWLRLNFGLRYEHPEAPRISGPSADVLLRLGAGASREEKLGGATLVPAQDNQVLYRADRTLLAPRLGFTARLARSGRTLARGSWGLFYDRPFDNLWQNLRNNSFVLSTALTSLPTTVPISAILPQLSGLEPDLLFSRLGLFPDRLRTPRTSTYFLGIEHTFTSSLSLQVYALGAYGQSLIATDIINRLGSVELTNGRWVPYRPDLPNIWHRTNEGESRYNALTADLQYRTDRTVIRATYTWGHSLDNQSEPLAGDFFDLLGTRAGAGASSATIAAFSRQFDAGSDHGNSDFDQRHNFTLSAIFDIPALATASRMAPALENWKVSGLFAARAGFPFTVLSYPSTFVSGPTIENRRADGTGQSPFLPEPLGAPGGKQILNSGAFQLSDPQDQGTSSRNGYASPGYFTLDVSLARSFPVGRREGCRLTFRADAFNLLNHTNLGYPAALLGGPDFGVALYGRTGRAPVFPSLTPYTENPRQIQLSLRFDF